MSKPEPGSMEALMQKMIEAMEKKDQQIDKLIKQLGTNHTGTQESVIKISIEPFDSNTELWEDYQKRFVTAATACNLPENLKAATFLSKQSRDLYKDIDV